MTERRYDFTRLVDLMGCAPSTAARRLGVSGRELKTYMQRGVTERVADRLAVRAGFVMAEIWPEAIDHAIADETVECEAPDCPETFVRKNRGAHRRYCSDNCRDRTNARRRYQSTPELRERKRSKVREYDRLVREAKARRRAA